MLQVQVRSFVEYCGNNKVKSCGYCKTNKGHKDHGMWLHYLTTLDYQNLIDRGWRRSGCYGYKPIMHEACCPLYTIRCNACDLKLSKSQKKVMKRFNRFLLCGDRKKCYNKETRGNEFSEPLYTSFESHSESKLISCNPGTSALPQQSTIVKPAETVDVSNITAKNEIPKYNERKKKTQRFEKAKWKLMNKGKTEDEAVNTLKAKRKIPEVKTVEKFLNDYEKSKTAHTLDIKIVQSSPKNELFEQTFEAEYEVYRKYQITIHKDEPDNCTANQFRRFLIDSPLAPLFIGVENAPVKAFGSHHQQYWLDGKLIAVGVIDILPFSVSSVYFFYDPDYSDLILGTYGSMRELELVRKLQMSIPSLRYYYMGYYIHSCRKMRYKGRIAPSYLLCPETYTWHPIEKCFDKINVLGSCRLNEDRKAVDENKATETNDVPVLRLKEILPYCEYSRKFKTNDINEIKEYVKSVGKKCAGSIVLCRG